MSDYSYDQEDLDDERLDGSGLDDEPGIDPVDIDEEASEEGRERTYRSVGILAAVVLVAFLGVAMLINTADTGVVTADTIHADSSGPGNFDEKPRLSVPPPAVVLSSYRPRDTVYTTDSIYLEVNLKKQDVTVHFRDGASRTFLVSSGNPYISEGMATPMGIFTVQNMVTMALSKQFNNARLHNWIGVQGGVGFHGLDGSGYYGYLGVRPSSHGCLRMSKEEIAKMYKLVHPGALIMVHGGNPARVVAFCDPADTAGATIIDSAAVHNRGLGKERLRALYEGRFWTDAPPRLVHMARQRLRWGMEIGDAGKIRKQKLPHITYLKTPRRFLARHPADLAHVAPNAPALAEIARVHDSVMTSQKAEWKREESQAQYRE